VEFSVHDLSSAKECLFS